MGLGTYQRNKVEELTSPLIDVSGHEQVRLQYRRWLTVEDGDFDQAEILSGDTQLWTNLASGGRGLDHVDREWRFHDVDLTSAAAQNGGQIQLTYRLTSDGGVQLGGWTLDDFCIVGVEGPTSRCGDGKVDAGEACDDGNTAPGDGCEADCTLPAGPMCGNAIVEAGEQCDDGNGASGDGCEPSCVISSTPDPEEPKLLQDESGCACTAHHAGPSSSASLWIVLAMGIVLVVRRRSSRA